MTFIKVNKNVQHFQEKREATSLYIELLKNMDSYKTLAFPIKKILLVKKKPAVLPLPSVNQNENSNIPTSI